MKLLLTCKLKLTLQMQQGKLPIMQGKQNVVQRKKKELHKQFMLNALGDFEHMMLNRKVQRMSFHILAYILKTLYPCSSPKFMKEVMEKILSHPSLNH